MFMPSQTHTATTSKIRRRDVGIHPDALRRLLLCLVFYCLCLTACPPVLLQRLLVMKTFLAHIAVEWIDARVDPQVFVDIRAMGELFAACRALVGLFARM